MRDYVDIGPFMRCIGLTVVQDNYTPCSVLVTGKGLEFSQGGDSMNKCGSLMLYFMMDMCFCDFSLVQ